MRDIKFRGLSVKSKEWHNGDLIHGVSSHAGEIFILPAVMNLAYVKDCHPLDGVQVDPRTVGQYTGLKDKNGVEIYEGDIIELNHWRPKRWEVTFDRGGFCMRDKPDANYYPDCKYTEKAIVLGNIYENPELMEN